VAFRPPHYAAKHSPKLTIRGKTITTPSPNNFAIKTYPLGSCIYQSTSPTPHYYQEKNRPLTATPQIDRRPLTSEPMLAIVNACKREQVLTFKALMKIGCGNMFLGMLAPPSPRK
jgi:hypothetical protein